jgi:hypothetical protein
MFGKKEEKSTCDCGCCTEIKKPRFDEGRFYVKEDSKSQIGHSSYAFILVDRETGVNYLFLSGEYRQGLTPLLDVDGNVIVSK